MPAFDLSSVCRAPALDVFGLLHDPSRIADWWSGTDRVETDRQGRVTRYAAAYPDFPYPLGVSRRGDAVTISCLLSDIRYEWRLRPHDAGCAVSARVEVPEAEAHRLESQRAEVGDSLARLVRLAESEAAPAG